MMRDMKQKEKRPAALHVAAKRQEAAELRAHVIEHLDEILDRYVSGEAITNIAATLPFKISAPRLHGILMDCNDVRDAFIGARAERAHQLVERALAFSQGAAALGTEAGLKVAIDAHLKIASKLNPEYNDKASVELTGKNGGPIKMISMSDDDLLKIAAAGLQEKEN